MILEVMNLEQHQLVELPHLSIVFIAKEEISSHLALSLFEDVDRGGDQVDLITSQEQEHDLDEHLPWELVQVLVFLKR